MSPGVPTSDQRRTRRHSRLRPTTLLKLSLFFIVVVFAIHASLISMPYFWDEVGYYVPAAWDLYGGGALISHSAIVTLHPPGVPAWVALWWKVFHPAVPVSRMAMLLLGAFTLLAGFLLAVELCGALEGAPAFMAVALLAASPLIYTQSLLVQLDLPAALLTTAALYLFLTERHLGASIACCLLVMTKETGALVPLVFAVWLAAEARFRRAAVYLAPLALTAGWLVYVHAKTGSWFGSEAFGRYNLTGNLTGTFRWSHVLLALARRVYFVFIGNFHWIGTLAILGGLRAGLFRRRRWAVAAVLASAHIVMVSVLGGAVLERYLLPVLPVFYAAAAAGLTRLSMNWRWAVAGGWLAGLVAGLFINPLFWPFPYENNLAMLDFTSLQRQTAESLAREYPHARVATTWPLSAVLSNPRWGYVDKPFRTVELSGYTGESFAPLAKDDFDVLVRYSRDWDPEYNLLRRREFLWAARILLSFREPLSTDELTARYNLREVHILQRGGQWVEIFVRQ
jgi:hypothetical protein